VQERVIYVENKNLDMYKTRVNELERELNELQGGALSA